jgi:hypothetical protein
MLPHVFRYEAVGTVRYPRADSRWSVATTKAINPRLDGRFRNFRRSHRGFRKLSYDNSHLRTDVVLRPAVESPETVDSRFRRSPSPRGKPLGEEFGSPVNNLGCVSVYLLGTITVLRMIGTN